MKKYTYKAAGLLASALLMGSTAALAAAANYPAPFVQGGTSDVAVVWGANSAPTDLVAVTDITAHLQAELAKQTTASTTTGSSTVTGGDFVLLAKSSDKTNLRDTISSVYGTTVDKDDLPVLLADVTYNNDENQAFDAEQKITLANTLKVNFFADSDYKDEAPTIGINLSSSAPVLNYTLDFLTDAESDVSGGDLVDIETTDLTILGKKYYVLDADNSTLKLTLLDSAVTSTVQEGVPKTVTTGTKTYEVSIGFISSTKVSLVVNEETTKSLAESETYKLKDGTYIGIKEIRSKDVAGAVGTVDISIGSGKLEITNAANIELNDDTISGVKGYVTRGSATGGKETLDKVEIEWKTDEDAFVTAEQGLTMPGFGAVKLSMGSFVTPSPETIKVRNDGTDTIEMEVPIKDGTVKIDLLSANSSGEFNRVGGDSASKILMTDILVAGIVFNSSIHKEFVASYNTSRDSESYLVRFANIREEDGKNRTDVEKNVGGTWTKQCTNKAAASSCKIGNVELTINSVTDAGTTETRCVNFTGATGTSLATLFTKGGLAISLPIDVEAHGGTQTAKGSINLSAMYSTAGHSGDSFYLYMTEENKDGDVGAGSQFYLTLDDRTNGELEVSDITPGANTFKEIENDDNVVGMVPSDLSSKVRRLGDTSTQRTAEVTYYGSETYAQVYITDTSAKISGGSGSSGVKELGSVSVSDAEAASVATKNLVVVGGSCVNKVAAELVGGALCGANWEASTKVGAGQFLIQTFSRTGGKVATLVAGYNAGDTTNAAKFLTTQAVDTTVGKKYVGTTATNAALVTA